MPIFSRKHRVPEFTGGLRDRLQQAGEQQRDQGPPHPGQQCLRQTRHAASRGPDAQQAQADHQAAAEDHRDGQDVDRLRGRDQALAIPKNRLSRVEAIQFARFVNRSCIECPSLLLIRGGGPPVVSGANSQAGG